MDKPKSLIPLIYRYFYLTFASVYFLTKTKKMNFKTVKSGAIVFGVVLVAVVLGLVIYNKFTGEKKSKDEVVIATTTTDSITTTDTEVIA